jgi:hypothetical protein
VLLTVGVEELTTAFRLLAVVGPIAVGLIAYRLAREIGGRSGRRLGPDAGFVLRRTSDGGFEEVEP